MTLRIKSALALSEGGNGGARRGLGTLPMAYRSHDRDRSVCGERTDSPTEVGRHPDAFEVTLPRLLTFGFGCGGFVLGEAFMADYRIELSGKFPANGLLQRERI